MTDQLQQIIRNCGVTHCQLAKRARVEESIICRFMNGEGGLSLVTLDRLSELLQIQLISKVKLQQGRGRGRPRKGD